MRVAKLDANGDGLAGATSGYIYSSVIEAGLGVEVEDGDEIIKKDGCGNICVNFRGPDIIKRSTIDLKICTLDSELISLLIGSPRIINGSTTIGGRVQQISDAAPNGVCLEFWTKAWNGSEQAKPTVLGGVNTYWHWVMPKAKFQLDPIELNNDAGEVALKGYGYENTALNIDGPYNDWGSSVAIAGGIPSCLGWFLDTSIPTTGVASTCGFQTVPAQGS